MKKFVIYRLRYINGYPVADNKPEKVYNRVSAVHISPAVFYLEIEGHSVMEQVNADFYNYRYEVI